MKKLAMIVCASAVLLSGTVALTPAASATAPASTVSAANRTPGCVTKSEYKKAKKGMTEKKIKQIFGTNGKREARASSGGYVSEIRSYRTCSEFSVVVISFEKEPGGKLRLDAKDAVWVS